MTVLDLEAGLPHDPKASVLLACWDDGEGVCGNEWVQDRGWGRVAAALRSDGLLVAHNARFELGWLLRDGVLSRGEIKDLEVWDTFLAEWVLAGNRNWDLDLDSCVRRRGLTTFKHRYVKSIFKSKDFKSGAISLLDIPRSKLLPYCKSDVRASKELYLKQKALIQDQEQEHILRQRHRTCVVLTDIATHGLSLDKIGVQEAHSSATKEMNELRESIVEDYEGINLNSPDQLATLIYDTLEFPVPKVRGKECLTPKGKRKTDEGTLALLTPKTDKQREFLDKYFKSNKLSSLISKYLNYFMVACDYYGSTIYGEIRQGTTATHRLSSAGTPLLDPVSKKLKRSQLQNIPRELKELFKAEDEEWCVVEADYGSLEFVSAADQCNDSVAKDDIVNGDKSKGTDPHSNTARILTENGEPTSRQDAKSSTFSPLYGGMGKSKAEKVYVEYFRDRYKGISKTQDGWARSVAESKSGLLKTGYGMRFYFPGTTVQRSGYVTNTTQIFNYPIQGFATGEIVPVALRLVWERVFDKDWVKIVNTVHDSIILVCRKDRVSDLLAILKQAMLDDTLDYMEKEYDYKFSTPLSVEVKAGDRWGRDSLGSWEWSS